MSTLIIINGCTRGLGLAIVKCLVSKSDFSLLCLVRDNNHLSGLSSLKNDLLIFKCDYSIPEDALQFGEYLETLLDGTFDKVYFINNISTLHPVGPIGNINNEDIILSLNTNINSNLVILNNIISSAVKKKILTFVLNISSSISINPLPGLSLYGIAKTYLDYVTKSLNLENNKKNVQASTFYPGGIDTDMQATLVKSLRNRDDLKEYNYQNLFTQKVSSSEKIAEVICNNFILNHNGWKNATSNIYDYLKTT